MNPQKIIVALSIVLTLVGTQAKAEDSSGKHFIAVGIAGFGTSKAHSEDLFSNELGPNAQIAGPWDNLPAGPQIEKRVFLTHFAAKEQLEQTLALVLDDEGKCRSDRGMILMGNSWGATNTYRLAKMYLEKCGHPVDIVVLVDGIKKPLIQSWSHEIPAEQCFNYYQRNALVEGKPIPNCENHKLEGAYFQNKTLFSTHVAAEWEGTEQGSAMIGSYIAKAAPAPTADTLIANTPTAATTIQ